MTKRGNKSFYSSARYWEDRYAKSSLSDVGVERNEWFVDFAMIAPSFTRFLPDPPADLSFLDVGCGMSLLPWSICEANYGRVTGIDISESAVRVLNEKYVGEKRLKFLKMDACEMTFNEKSFDVSIDKGTLDALLTGVNDDVSLEQLKQQHPEVLKILNEIYRVTSNIFFLISHSDNRSALLSEAGFVVMRKIELQNHLRKYHLYFSIKNVNEEMYKNAMKHMAEMQNDFLDNATS
jgi:SAM-dependent methyltransferase